MGTIRTKGISGGETAHLIGWFDPGYQRELFQVRIKGSDGATDRLVLPNPNDLVKGTREYAERIFDAISPEDDAFHIGQKARLGHL